MNKYKSPTKQELIISYEKYVKELEKKMKGNITTISELVIIKRQLDHYREVLKSLNKTKVKE